MSRSRSKSGFRPPSDQRIRKSQKITPLRNVRAQVVSGDLNETFSKRDYASITASSTNLRTINIQAQKTTKAMHLKNQIRMLKRQLDNI